MSNLVWWSLSSSPDIPTYIEHFAAQLINEMYALLMLISDDDDDGMWEITKTMCS